MQVECAEGVAGAAVEERGDDVVLVLRQGALEPGDLRAVRDVLARVHGRLVGRRPPAPPPRPARPPCAG